MCNFIVRPIKSYATIDLVGDDHTIKRGDVLDVKHVESLNVVAMHGDKEVSLPLDLFVRLFTANPEDIKKIREEEAEWFKPVAKKPDPKSK